MFSLIAEHEFLTWDPDHKYMGQRWRQGGLLKCCYPTTML